MSRAFPCPQLNAPLSADGSCERGARSCSQAMARDRGMEYCILSLFLPLERSITPVPRSPPSLREQNGAPPHRPPEKGGIQDCDTENARLILSLC